MSSELHDEMIRDCIVLGIRNASFSEKLQLNPELTLEKTIITSVRQTEAVKEQQSLLPGVPVGAIHKSRRGTVGSRNSGASTQGQR